MSPSTSRRAFLATMGATTIAAAIDGPSDESSKSSSPSLIVIMVDELQAQRLRLYGGTDLNTPHIDRLAADGALFRQAITTSPICMPSRASFWTGQYPHAAGVVHNGPELAENVASLPRMLQDKGYATALIGKDHCFGGAQEKGLFDASWHSGHGGADSHKDDPQVKQYQDVTAVEFLRMTHGQILDLPDHVTSTARTTEQALKWLEDRTVDEPFFLWLSYPDPHSPFVTTRNYANRYDPAKLTLPKSWKSDVSGKPAHLRELHALMDGPNVTEEHVRRITQIYYGMVSQIDDGIGEVLDMLDRKKLSENTIVVFLSDHGEYMGNFGIFQKSAHLYDCLISVPLIVRWPKRIKAQTIDALVEHHDLMPTLCTYLGLAIPDKVQGRDLSGLLDGAPYTREAVFSEIGYSAPDREYVYQSTHAPELSWLEARAFFHFITGHYAQRAKCVRTRTHKLVAYEYGERELYDLVADPEETVNLYGRPEMAAIQNDLANRLLEWMIQAEENPLPNVHARKQDVFTGLKKQLAKTFSRLPDAK